MEFVPHPTGLHYFELEKCKNIEMLVVIIRDNYEEHTKHKLRKVIEARKLQGMLGHLSQRDFKGMVHHNKIKNCFVKAQDVSNAYKVFDHKRKIVRTKSEKVLIVYVIFQWRSRCI